MKNIYVLTIEEKSCNFLVNTLQDNIGEFANILALNCEEKLEALDRSDLIITAGKKSYEKAKTLFSSNQIIVAKRNLNFTKLGEINSLPRGKPVLVINYSQPPTLETIYSLKELGLDHLRYVPYWKDSKIDAESFDTALSPGMIDLCPENVNNKIDIGMRNISFSTYIQILLHLEMDVEYIDAFTQNYTKLHIENYKHLNSELEQVKTLKHTKKSFIFKKGFTANWVFDDIIGKTDYMKTLIDKAKLISRTDSTVLLMGESGTGKELFAHAIHNESSRRDGPFIAVNFAAMPESLVESELFGYEEGAFTGAKRGGRPGLFEQANGGTIFLDEIGDASLHTQKRLLRVLQEKEIMRLGATKRMWLDVRIIAATNKDLLNLIKEKLFREDLYYRLRVCPLTIPPLRKRQADIPQFIQVFMDKYGVYKFFSDEAREALINYPWPGNIRELKNTIEYIANISENIFIELEDLPKEIQRSPQPCQKFAELKESSKELKCLFHQEDIFFILKTLSEHKAKSTSIGRKKLANLARKAGLHLTENKIRTRLEYLSNHGLVVTGKTKQGTLITDKGERAILKFQV